MPLKVLIVDDATFVRDMVKRTLRQVVPDIELLEAPDGVRAQSLIKSKKPDLILSDWEMPNLSGHELLKWLRAEPELAAIPFVMITSRGDRSHVMKAVEAGVNDYLSKPFSAEELTRKFAKQLQRLGYDFKSFASKRDRGIAFASVDVLTGGRQPTQAQAAAPAAPTAPTSAFSGSIFLRFAHGNYAVELKELTLQSASVVLARPEIMPTVFDQVAVDLVDDEGHALARLNAYIHAVAATEAHSEATRVRILARFVDEDPAKQKVLQALVK